ncbi:MAG: peroxiredoxin [Rhizobiales bacterium 65-9]|nr:peroxiredoxin [Hyphomicrobiales bacterium]OJY35341.1 MAG: peroxiredoxin [Rhizobiales bacterium 65-9]
MTKELAAGDMAPAFDLPASGGERVSSRQLHGRKVVLFFYPKDDTPTCTREAIDFNRLRDAFEKTGTALVGVSVDDAASHAKFARKHALAIPLISDETRSLIDAYGLWVKKSMFGHAYMGTERTTVLIGADGRIARIWRKVKTPGHAEEVLAAAQSA